MTHSKTDRTKITTAIFGALFFVLFFQFTAVAQKKSLPAKRQKISTQQKTVLPKVTQIDLPELRNLIKPNGKPLLINFWATWCDPCREEFPDLVRIAAEYKDKIDVITISLDYLSEINRDVPKFLAEMKAEMPAYLLKTDNEDDAMRLVSKNWQGALPFTILYDATGKESYSRQAKFNTETLTAEIDKSLNLSREEYFPFKISQLKIRAALKGKSDAETDISKGLLKVQLYGFAPGIAPESLRRLKKKYGIEIVSNGCVLGDNGEIYFKAYNEVVRAEIIKRFGEELSKIVP